MPNALVDTHIMSMRIRRYVSAGIGSFRDRSRSRNRRRTYHVSGTPSNSASTSSSHPDLTYQSNRRSQVLDGIEGFDELRQVLKTGSDVSREIASIIADRAALEISYAKSLQKLSSRLIKACSTRQGTTAAAWETVGEEMNSESETHQKIGESLMEDICKPLRNMCENHIKVKKPIELAVEKATRTLSDRRLEEQKYKQKSFNSTEEAERLHSLIIDKRTSAKKTPEKELLKLDKKLAALKESIRKSGRKYYSSSLGSERSRQEWECTSIKSMSQLQQLEEERLRELHRCLTMYRQTLESVAPQMSNTCQRLGDAAVCIDFEKDLRKIVDSRHKAIAQPEQILFEIYAEDMNHEMDKERRRQALTLYIYYLAQDIEIERKGVDGVQKLMDIYKNQPDYADYEAMEETKRQARQVHAMLNFLDASHYKLSKSLNQTSGSQENLQYKFSTYMETSIDKTGLPTTVLRVPTHLIAEGFNEADFSSRGRADGSHDSPTDGTPYESIEHDDYYSDNDVDDEFEDNYDIPPRHGYGDSPDLSNHQPVICRCRVLYDFSGTQSTELTVKEGNEVNILEKHDDGWWKAEIRGCTGLIPETYVEEIS
ncbi:NOSTRIN [Bugula neritina]|uniref:NOSTRIN n=1 Tax=Bugula neritina TaxID=10212 RepID=A0A7J7IYY3_BUGNE|nr:NOSTRIN [Bugula neritina]